MTTVERGSSHPLGPTITSAGTNFSLYSQHASSVDLLLYDSATSDAPGRVIPLERTGEYWHAFVSDIGHGQCYAYRVDGPWQPARGLRFDARHRLLDPYGRGVSVPTTYRRSPASVPLGDAEAMKSVLVDLSRYDWEGDRPLGRSLRETIVYEAHVRGFTAHPNSGVEESLRGTYAGFIEKIPYLVELGITAVELLPVFHFDALAAPQGLVNYWGYQPVAFFAPHVPYSSRPDALSAADEFRDLVKALHRAGLEVILDVVYNHTAEGGPDDTTFCFRGLANDDYYILAADPNRYADFSGTGNTFAASNPIARRLILDSLRFWVSEMHVDGFRFDLAAILSRDDDGRPLSDPPTLWDIETDPVLASTKLIAEAWDAGGLYEVGSFVGDRWIEWNGRFRDDVRSFVKSDAGLAGTVTQRILGSPDIYGRRGRQAQESVNFVTCHDGFTLNDVVSYDAKHNEANGEQNRDGSDENHSWNCGAEGPSHDPAVESLRERQVKNLLALDLLAVGLPMLLMGDEVRRTQQGNNNAYCHDSELVWFDWGLVTQRRDLLAFVQRLTRGRRRLQSLLEPADDVSLLDLLHSAEVRLSGVRYGQPDLSDSSRSAAISLAGHGVALYLVLNAYWEPLDFELPPPFGEPASGQDHGWRAVLDTSLPSPRDLVTYREALPINGETYRVGPRSVVLLARPVATPRPAGSGTTQQPAVQVRRSAGSATRTRRTLP